MLSRLNRAYLRASGRISGLAMAKVEGSNPFIRFTQNPLISGGFVVSMVGRVRRLLPWVPPVRTKCGCLVDCFSLRVVHLGGEREADILHLARCPSPLRNKDAPQELGTGKAPAVGSE
jgi:hypothetical protein